MFSQYTQYKTTTAGNYAFFSSKKKTPDSRSFCRLYSFSIQTFRRMPGSASAQRKKYYIFQYLKKLLISSKILAQALLEQLQIPANKNLQ